MGFAPILLILRESRFLICLTGVLNHPQRKADAVAARLQEPHLSRLFFLIGRRTAEFALAQCQRGGEFLIGIAFRILRQRGSSDSLIDTGAF